MGLLQLKGRCRSANLLCSKSFLQVQNSSVDMHEGSECTLKVSCKHFANSSRQTHIRQEGLTKEVSGAFSKMQEW